jgi:subtilisin family serine protease
MVAVRLHVEVMSMRRGMRCWVYAVTMVVCAYSQAAISERRYVVRDRYIVQRKPQSLAALSATQVTYTVVKSAEFFDVVVPSQRASERVAQSLSRKEVLDPIKVAADCAEIRKDPTVESCDPDAVFYPSALPNDPAFLEQWFLDDTAADADVEAPTAWDRGTGSEDVLIGVVDTGVYWSHPDLIDNMWRNPNEVADGIDNDGNGYIDDILGVNTVTNGGDPNDPDGHGTHVAGIIGGRGNNGVGISGVMWRVSLIGVSATTTNLGEFELSDLVEGLDYFYRLKKLGHNVRAVNASWGGGPYTTAMYQAIERLNNVDILLVCAAGNEDSNNDLVPDYPSNFDLPNVLSVGATGPTKQSTWYSNYGQSVDIAAPGGDSFVDANGTIYSTYNAPTPNQLVYARLQGTSMAAPIVTGALGLLASQRPYLTGTHLRDILLATADAEPALVPWVNGGRFLNIGAMSVAPDPLDECLDDPNKLVPGVCGCGVVESYGDSDNDGALTCVESCPNDPSKTAPGVCGCGVSDADLNGNGTADCLDPVDQCPTDSLKIVPGVCGCGATDEDRNSNGVVDCLDPKVAGVTPASPILKVVNGRVRIKMSPLKGVSYEMKITRRAPKARGKTPKLTTTYRYSSSRSYVMKTLRSRTRVTVRYAYVIPGTPRVTSNFSVPRSVTVK